MYDWLCRWLPPRWAAVLLVIAYLALILLVLWTWRSAEVPFRYGRI